MQVTRRQFIAGGTASIGATLSPAFLRFSAASAASAADNSLADARFSLLGRLSYGPTAETRETFATSGLKHYLEEQLHPQEGGDTLCNSRLSQATLHVEYKDGDGYKGLKEDRPLLSLGAPVEDLWKLTDGKTKMDGKERNLPAQEVRAATWIRAVYSHWQLREMMTEFWHNHFNVSTGSGWQIAATLPLYDALMRRHCFGNFRAMLEGVAESAAMEFYLNNVKSKASPANENYARELFELHTLGADHYYNNLYNRWREVPGALSGRPIGYIDQDVYEAARAFTGWTIEDGAGNGKGGTFPRTGKFTYFDGWHDNYQKRVLGNEFDPNMPPMNDGRKVLDLVAAHPGTAMHLCTKLCRRLVADNPPASLVKKAAKTWQKSLHHPEQIKEVLRTIILSPEFAQTQGKKIKRPFELIVSFLRTTGADFAPTEGVFGTLNGTGYRQFEWPTPTGHPDTSGYWLNTNSMLSSWNMMAGLLGGGMNNAARFDLAGQMPASVGTSGQIVSYWTERMLARQPDNALFTSLMQFMPRPQNPDFAPDKYDPSFKEPLQHMVLAIGMLPEFQVRG